MLIIALTGGLGAGKSTAAAYFRDRGAVTIDLDEIAARLLSADSGLAERVADEFGRSDVLDESGRLDRAALARVAFREPSVAARLNAIVHPAVAREVGPAIAEIRLLPHQPEVVVLEVPLLVEAPVFAEMADRVLAIAAPLEARVARATAGGMTEADARARIAAQATDEARAALADDVIVNDGDEQEFIGRLAAYWDERIGAGPN